MSLSIPYVQRKLDAGEVASTQSRQQCYGEDLHSLLFHPIAGDGMQQEIKHTSRLPPLLCMKRLQFGLLDADAMRELSVAQITNAGCGESPSFLNDLRMGASAGGKACQTCGQHHHNCPDPGPCFAKHGPVAGISVTSPFPIRW